MIHSIDSVDLLQKIDAAAREARRTPELLIQVDLAGEATKFGATPEQLQPIFDAAASLTNARLVGLMVLPPWSEDPEVARPYFRRLRELRDELGSRGVPAASLRELSMGMSHDFEVAIAEGATMVRVGTAIFGKRTPPAPSRRPIRPSADGHVSADTPGRQAVRIVSRGRPFRNRQSAQITLFCWRSHETADGNGSCSVTVSSVAAPGVGQPRMSAVASEALTLLCY